MGEKESEEKNVKWDENAMQAIQTQSYPLVNSQGKMLLPPAEAGEGCPTPTYANPKQILRILKRREMKRRLAFSGKLSKRVQDKRKAENEANIKKDHGATNA